MKERKDRINNNNSSSNNTQQQHTANNNKTKTTTKQATAKHATTTTPKHQQRKTTTAKQKRDPPKKRTPNCHQIAHGSKIGPKIAHIPKRYSTTKTGIPEDKNTKFCKMYTEGNFYTQILLNWYICKTLGTM